MANRAGGPKSEKGAWLPSASVVGAPGLLYADKESVFGHFQCQEIATGNYSARITVLVVHSKGRAMS